MFYGQIQSDLNTCLHPARSSIYWAFTHVPNTALSASQMRSHLLLTKLAQCHTAKKSQDVNSGLTLETRLLILFEDIIRYPAFINFYLLSFI